MRKWHRTKTAAGYVLEAIDGAILRHGFPRVCAAGWELLNGGMSEVELIDYYTREEG